MQILSHLDDNSLRPGQYRLATLDRLKVVKPAKEARALLPLVRTAAREQQFQAYAWLSRKFWRPLTDEEIARLLG